MFNRTRTTDLPSLAAFFLRITLLLLFSCAPRNEDSRQTNAGDASSDTITPAGSAPDSISLDDSGHVTGIVRNAVAESGRENSPLIVIDKSLRRLFLYTSGKLDTTFRVAFGPNPIDDKTRARDGCTPEGVFTIGLRTNEPWSSYYKSLMLNYPLPEDAERGREAGIIDHSAYTRIMRAHGGGHMPDQYTRLGGNICIHGCGSSRDWTLGCVALDSPDMKYLYSKVGLGDKCIIQK